MRCAYTGLTQFALLRVPSMFQVRRLQLSTGKAEQEAENIRQKRQQATDLKRGLIEKLELQR